MRDVRGRLHTYQSVSQVWIDIFGLCAVRSVFVIKRTKRRLGCRVCRDENVLRKLSLSLVGQKNERNRKKKTRTLNKPFQTFHVSHQAFIFSFRSTGSTALYFGSVQQLTSKTKYRHPKHTARSSHSLREIRVRVVRVRSQTQRTSNPSVFSPARRTAATRRTLQGSVQANYTLHMWKAQTRYSQDVQTNHRRVTLFVVMATLCFDSGTEISPVTQAS